MEFVEAARKPGVNRIGNLALTRRAMETAEWTRGRPIGHFSAGAESERQTPCGEWCPRTGSPIFSFARILLLWSEQSEPAPCYGLAGPWEAEKSRHCRPVVGRLQELWLLWWSRREAEWLLLPKWWQAENQRLIRIGSISHRRRCRELLEGPGGVPEVLHCPQTNSAL